MAMTPFKNTAVMNGKGPLPKIIPKKGVGRPRKPKPEEVVEEAAQLTPVV